MNYKVHKVFPNPLYISNKKVDDVIVKFCLDQSKSYNYSNQISNNKNILKDHVMKDIKLFIEEHLMNYINNIVDPITKIKPFLTQSWLNFSYPNDIHHSHNHSNSFISGVYYIQTLEEDYLNIDKENNFIKLYPKTSNEFNVHRLAVQVHQGDLLLFPSHLIHGTNKNTTKDKVRISLAFNSFIQGDIGSIENLTYLKI